MDDEIQQPPDFGTEFVPLHALIQNSVSSPPSGSGAICQRGRANSMPQRLDRGRPPGGHHISVAFVSHRNGYEPPPGQKGPMVPDSTIGGARRSNREVYLHVMRALMLRDMRTRFGGSHFGYFIVVLWPVVHIFMLVAIYTFRHMPSPMSLPVTMFIASGAVPCLMFQYISREVMKSVMMNKPLTYYPQVKLIDVLFARIVVEIVTGFLGLLIVFAILIALGYDPRPADPFVAVQAYTMAIMLGIGIGTINVGIVSFFPAWAMGYVLFSIIMYATSGVFFLPSLLPEKIYAIMKYNPLVQIIEWMRLAYEPNIGFSVDYTYMVLWVCVSLTLGLMLERFVVRKR
ncbi:ABC transporter permease [Methylobacterium sp. Leaf399]|uniref:ABC transporter permease n=1 Tax=unclassified Methylobacterium TaxID=2615210 RepID=UPI00308272EB